MRVVAAVLVGVLCAASAAPVTVHAADDTPPVCNRYHDLGCSASEHREADEARLRAAGPSLVMACDPGRPWTEAPLSGDEMSACVETARQLAADLSAKWAGTLAPIDPGLLRYTWDHANECITFVSGYCVCPVHGYATLPLAWRDAPTAAGAPMAATTP